MSLTKKPEDKKASTEAPPAKYLELDDQDMVYQPNMELYYWRSMSNSPHCPPADATEMRKKLMDAIKEHKMVYLYALVAEEIGEKVDEALVKEWKKAEEDELALIQQAEEYSKENLGDMEVRDQLMRRAHFYAEVGALDKAVEAYNVALDKSVGVSPKLHVVLTIIRIAIAQKDVSLAKKEIKRATELLEKGGDWERRNKLKIYSAMVSVLRGNLEEAVPALMGGLGTFSATELISFEDFVLYTVCLANMSATRQDYRDKILSCPEVLQCAATDASLAAFSEALHKQDYQEGFKAILDIADRLKFDFFFGAHLKPFLTKLRLESYKAFLQPYRNVKIVTMANRFGLPESFMEQEVATFISQGSIPCRIDRVEGVIYSCTNTEQLADSILAEGDALQTKISKLTRIMYI